jgi:Tfp pilus assembly protein PilO
MPRSQAERLWIVGGSIVALMMLLVGYFFFISPQRSETADVDGQVQTARSANAVLQSKIGKLRVQNQQIAKFRTVAGAARAALPNTSDLSDFLRTLQQIGGATRTDVSSLAAGDPVDVSAVAAGGAPGSAPSSAAGTKAPSAPAAPSGPGVYALPITAVVNGSADALNQFLTQLQSVQPRAVLITQLTESVAGQTDGKGTKATTSTSISLTMYAFVSPGTAAESAQLQAAAGK